MSQIDWDLTIDTILAEKCMLFIGPEVFTDAQGRRLDERLQAYLDIDNSVGAKVYSDGLFYFGQKQMRTRTYLKIRRFFEENDFPEVKDLFTKISKIPFHFIVLITPDAQLANIFEEQNFKVRSDFYWKKHAPVNGNEKAASIPTAAKPLVYNMLGSIQRPESLVLTHDDLFDYLESIFQAQSMSERLKYHIIEEIQNIVFLGIPFDKWYMQLLMRVLHLHKDQDFMRFASSEDIQQETRTLYMEQFKINFVPSDTTEFINEVYQRCEARGVLRQAESTDKKGVAALIDQLVKGKLDQALQGFMEWLERIGEEGLDLLDDAILLSNRNRRLRRKLGQGVVDANEASIESNRISKSLLALLNEAKVME